MIPELTGSSLPASTSSADSGRYHTSHSSQQHQVLDEIGATDSNVLLRLQKDNEAKDNTIKTLQQRVNQLNKMLKYAEPLEDQIFRLTAEVSKYEEEKRKASVSHPLTQTYAHEQKQQELVQHYEQQYH